jgi:hypothetical protein
MAAASPEDMGDLAAEGPRTEAEDPAAVLRTAAGARVAERRVAARTEEVAAEVRVEAAPVRPVPVHLVQVEAATANPHPISWRILVPQLFIRDREFFRRLFSPCGKTLAVEGFGLLLHVQGLRHLKGMDF